MKPERLGRLPESICRVLKKTRLKRGWSQLELGRRVGLPQVHISNIETGKTVPRFDTLLDLVRVLGHDLVLVPQALVPMVQAIVRDHQHEVDGGRGGAGDRPLYAADDHEEMEYEDDQTFDT